MGLRKNWRTIITNINAFVIKINTTESGASNNDQFQFTGAEGNYNVVAKQSNLVVATFNDLEDEETITLPSSGVYVLEITAKEVNGFNRIQFANTGDKLKITDIKNWGNIVWSSFFTSFSGCANMLVTAIVAPNLTSVGNMQQMFSNAILVNPFVDNWNVVNVTNMRFLFLGANLANPNISNWNVINVTNMQSILSNSNLSTENLTACYENWSLLNLQQNVQFSAGSVKYSASGATGRQKLIDDFNWTITDGGQV